jgi:hypothetical protein
MPIHPITAAAYYSIGSTEFTLGHVEVAKSAFLFPFNDDSADSSQAQSE